MYKRDETVQNTRAMYTAKTNPDATMSVLTLFHMGFFG